jgi:hypothetical protein
MMLCMLCAAVKVVKRAKLEGGTSLKYALGAIVLA